MRELWDRPPSKRRMLALTFIGGIAMALLYAWPPLMIVAIVAAEGTGGWFWPAVGGAAVVFWAALFTLAVREAAAEQRYVEQL